MTVGHSYVKHVINKFERSPFQICLSLCVGIDLSFRAVASQVFSALQSLTSVFGMGTGGPSALKTPTPPFFAEFLCVSTDLFSRAVASQVFSALQSLTSVFGMGTGGPSALKVLTFWCTSRDSTPRCIAYPHDSDGCCSLFRVVRILVHLQGFEPGTH